MYGYYKYCIRCRLICFLGQSVFNLGQFVSRKPEIFSIEKYILTAVLQKFF